jgi:hypothetical protein
MHARQLQVPLAQLFRGAIMTSALLLATAPGFAQSISPSSDAGAATAGLIQFYGERCKAKRGYALTDQAVAFVNDAANARPATFRAGYTSEAHMPTQDCAGAYEHNLGPGGVGSTAVGFTIMRSAAAR